ncbi:cell division protein ZapA [Catalinimonas alkaloidigena]|uniref:Cell division protein ZapA n=1 Tax=Catalinimonas alkaloidigena TaxID=1075417 RepID=A0A1G9BLS5_9BACT|nr:cell division protein ZapA [Catalinimonas alkaloidigena]SDK40436.1 cell division protein ZapA [Catalinimonas alkaloidigena]
MGELSIKIKIIDREYPMRTEASDEERLRTAARLVNEQVSELRKRFGLDDKQDLLAMVAFLSLEEKMRAEEEKSTLERTLARKMSTLDDLISSVLAE